MSLRFWIKAFGFQRCSQTPPTGDKEEVYFFTPLNQNSHCVYMQEHNRVMNVSNEDWIHVNRFIRSASPNGSSQDRISKVDTIAGLGPSRLSTCMCTRSYRIAGSSRPAHA